MTTEPTGRLIGVGVGPGDPELLTLKAVRLLGEADAVGYFAKAGARSHARATVAGKLRADAIELPLRYPVTTEIDRHRADYRAAIADFFDRSAGLVEEHLRAGRTVAVLSEGDPFFYGSYMHLHVRLSPRYPTQVVPGVTSMSGCWSAAAIPLVQGDDVLTVLPGTMAEADLARKIAGSEAAVIMKVGRNLAKIRRVLDGAGKLAGAIYVERGTMENARCMPLGDKRDDSAPYFSVVLVPGWSERP